MYLLSLEEVTELHRLVVDASGGSHGIRDQGALEAAIAQPLLSFGGQDLYPTLIEKAAAMGSSLVQNHPFIDGNKRIGHAALEAMLMLNGFQLDAPVDEQESMILGLAAGKIDRETFTDWVKRRVVSAPDLMA